LQGPKGKGAKEGRNLTSLDSLPANAWITVGNDFSGIQYFTRVRIGLSSHEVMLDGGSAVNSTTEEIILELLNENKEKGINLSDKRHPVKQLEKWEKREALRGVASGKSVPLVGSAVIAINMTPLGKAEGPEILCRFKICKKGSTDWVGWILGARALDCPERGGLGFVPLEHCH
jgi:hypothetical protein